MDKPKRWLYLQSIDSMQLLEVGYMVLLGLSALLLGAGLQMQPQVAAPAAAPAPVTEVMAMVRLKPGVSLPDVMKLVPDEARGATQLYLEGKIDQWYTRSDGKGVVLFLHCKTVEEAKVLLADLPLIKAGYVEAEYIPVGPFNGLRILTRLQPAPDGTAPR